MATMLGRDRTSDASGVVAIVRRLVGDRADRLRYLCVGGLCFLLNWSVMLLIDRDHYVLSSALCFALVGTLAYTLHALWTFGTRLSGAAWGRYLAAMAPSYPMSLGVLALLHDLARLPLALAVPVATVVTLCLNYCVARWTILGLPRRRRSERQAPGHV